MGERADNVAKTATVAEESPDGWRLTDLIDLKTLQSIQDTFARAFGLPTVIVHPDGSNVTEITHRLRFCEDLTRTSPVGGPRCLECDLFAMGKAAGTSRPAIFECWNGLYDSAIPIAPKGTVLGYFLCGQIFTEPPDDSRYRATAKEIGAPPDEYVAAAKEVRVLPFEQYRASVESMHVLAQMIAEQAAAAMDNLKMLEDALKARQDASTLMEELDNILETFADIGSQPDYRSTLEAIADNLSRLVPYDSCLIYLVDEDNDELAPVVVRDPYPDALWRFRPRKGKGIVGKVAVTGVGRRVEDVRLDPDFEAVPGLPSEPEASLIVPMVHKGTLSGVISLSRFERRLFTEHEFRILSVISSTQAALAIENARMHERERELLDQYRLLADLGTDLVKARDERAIRELLLSKTAEIFKADACLLALRKDVPDQVGIDVRRGRRSESFSLALSGHGRLAGVRLNNEAMPDRRLFDAWTSELWPHIAQATGATSYLVEPLATASGVFGALFVTWNSGGERPRHEQRLLSVVAGAAGATLSNVAVYAETDSSLRRRVQELQTLTRLGESVTGLTEEARIIDELLDALTELGGFDGALYAVGDGSSWGFQRASGVAGDDFGSLEALLCRAGPLEGVTRLAHGADGEVVAVPLDAGGAAKAALVGLSDRRGSGDDALLSTLARFGSVAIENARLHRRQDQAIARLEQANLEASDQYHKLQRLLSVHEALTLAVLEGEGLASIARSLSELMACDVAIVGPQQGVLASWPPGEDFTWAVDGRRDATRSTVASDVADGRVVAAPAVVEGEVLAWVVARGRGPVGEIEQAAIEYGTLLTALDLLRERTAIEVETRLRGGLVEELLSSELVDERTLKQSLALGFDLNVSSRLFLVEPVSQDATRADVEAVYAAVSSVSKGWPRECLVALRGSSVVAIVHEPDGEPPRDGRHFEAALQGSLKRRLPQLPLNVSVGTACEALADYRRSYVAARRGLDLLRLLGKSGETFSFRGAGVEHLLLQSTEPDILLDFISSFVDPLDHYDRTHSSRLRESLETYYGAGMNLEEAARRLHVHVSTLRYRLGKIEELLGVDTRGEARLSVELALRAARVLSSYRQ